MNETQKKRVLRWIEGISGKIDKGQELASFERKLLLNLLAYVLENDRKIGPAFIETIDRMEKSHKFHAYDKLFLVPYLNSMVDHARNSSRS